MIIFPIEFHRCFEAKLNMLFFYEYKETFFNAFITPISLTTEKIPQKLTRGSRSFAGNITEGLFGRK